MVWKAQLFLLCFQIMYGGCNWCHESNMDIYATLTALSSPRKVDSYNFDYGTYRAAVFVYKRCVWIRFIGKTVFVATFKPIFDTTDLIISLLLLNEMTFHISICLIYVLDSKVVTTATFFFEVYFALIFPWKWLML